ncbi:MAG: SCO family protein [Ignavibacteriaceae bacterium]|nr:SCO family protein [Ignavibacteriaceae bacterium]
MKTNFKLLSVFLFIIVARISFAASNTEDIGIVEKLGSYIPLDVTFNNEDGNKVILRDLVKRPTLIAFVYYKCPGICSPMLTELANVTSKVDLIPGEDYNIIAISMDDREKPSDASDKKKTILGFTQNGFPLDAWDFLTGDSINIKKAANAAGFYFKRTGDNFIHSGGFIFITKEGKICRYIYPDVSMKGTFNILPFDFKMALLETSQGVQTKTMAKLVQYCFSYDPAGRKYVFNITRVFGTGILILLTLFFVFYVIKPKKEKIVKR